MKALQVIALEGNRGFPTNNEVNPWTLTLGPLPLSLSDALHVLARNRNTWHVGQKESTETAPRSLKICSLEAVLETMCLSEGAVLLCTVVLPYGPGWTQTRDCPVGLWRLRTAGGHVPSCPAPREVQLSHLGYSGQEHTRHTTAAERKAYSDHCLLLLGVCYLPSRF